LSVNKNFQQMLGNFLFDFNHGIFRLTLTIPGNFIRMFFNHSSVNCLIHLNPLSSILPTPIWPMVAITP